MATALLNTLLGMGTVFIVLIFISFIISLFGLINKVANKPKKVKTADAPAETSDPVSTPVKASSDDGELVAVIAAAIAASMTEATGQYVSADGLVIRSIKKRR